MSDYFRQLAIQQNWATETQVDVLLAYVQTHCPEGIQQYLLGLVQTQTQAEGAAALQEVSTFFDKAIFDPTVRERCQLVTSIDSQPLADAGYQARCCVPADGLAQVRTWLQQPTPLTGFDPEGELIFGYRVELAGDNTAVFALLNSPHGPWIDAWVQAPDGQGPSVPPTCSIDELFEFDWPDGSKLVFQFVSAAD